MFQDILRRYNGKQGWGLISGSGDFYRVRDEEWEAVL